MNDVSSFHGLLLMLLLWQVTYGSVLKLMHEKTRFRLHSHDVPYGSGSGQQSVTGFPGVDDSNGYWVFFSVRICSWSGFVGARLTGFLHVDC